MKTYDGLEGALDPQAQDARERHSELPFCHAQFKTCYDAGGISLALALAFEWMDGSFLPIGRILHMCGMLMLRSGCGPIVEMETECSQSDAHGENQREQVTLWAWSLDRVPEIDL